MRKHDFEALFMSNEKKDVFAFKITCELLGAEDIPSAPKNKDVGTHES